MTTITPQEPTYDISAQTKLIEAFLNCSQSIAEGFHSQVVLVTKSVHGVREHIIVPEHSLTAKLDQYLMTYTKDLELATDNEIRIIDATSLSLIDVPNYIKEVF